MIYGVDITKNIVDILNKPFSGLPAIVRGLIIPEQIVKSCVNGIIDNINGITEHTLIDFYEYLKFIRSDRRVQQAMRNFEKSIDPKEIEVVLREELLKETTLIQRSWCGIYENSNMKWTEDVSASVCEKISEAEMAILGFNITKDYRFIKESVRVILKYYVYYVLVNYYNPKSKGKIDSTVVSEIYHLLYNIYFRGATGGYYTSFLEFTKKIYAYFHNLKNLLKMLSREYSVSIREEHFQDKPIDIEPEIINSVEYFD